MIKLTLLHPLQSTPVRTWTFKEKLAIAIGRSTHNDVVLYSSVVSRHHVQLNYVNGNWEIINVGKNGTYLNGKAIANDIVVDGMEIELAGSGPKIVINIDNDPPKIKSGEKVLKYGEANQGKKKDSSEEGIQGTKGEDRTKDLTLKKE